jgi:hypothetical protein
MTTLPGGCTVRDGIEAWRDGGGVMRLEARWSLGRRTGLERWRRPDGSLAREVEHGESGRSVVRCYGVDGSIVSESQWSGTRADGLARRWSDGRLVGEVRFQDGRRIEE